MTDRQHSPAAYNAVKTAVKQLYHEIGGLDAMASCTRVGRSQLSEYGSTHSPLYMPVDVVMDAETIAGHPHVTATLARTQGYTLLRMVPREAGDIGVALAEVGRDTAALFADAATALSHGKPTTTEQARLVRDLDELLRVVTDARQVIAGFKAAPGRE